MIIGVDTSGKIGDFPLYVSAVKMKSPILEDLKKSVGKRKLVFLTRRKLDARYLNNSEVELLLQSIDYSLYLMSSNIFSSVLKRFRYLSEPRYKIASSAIYIALKSVVMERDVVLVDKDYDYGIMRIICSTVKILFKRSGLNVEIEVGTSYNEVIALADIVAKLGRIGRLKAKRLEEEMLSSEIEILKSTGRPIPDR